VAAAEAAATAATSASKDAATAAAGAAAVANMVSTNTSSSMSQGTSLALAGAIDQLGASQAAGLGALECAQGANVALENPVSGGALIQSCQAALNAATQMKQMELANNQNQKIDTNSPLTASNSVVDSSEAEEVFTNLETNYGVSKSDFVTKVLSSGGETGALADILGDKMPKEKLEAAIGAAQDLSAEDRQKLLDEYKIDFGSKITASTAGNALKKKVDSFRDSLRENLAAADGKAVSNEKRFRFARRPAEADFKNLTPAFGDEAPFSAVSSSATELTLFDVVHQKYAEKAQFLGVHILLQSR
jgi:hypothetical protein